MPVLQIGGNRCYLSDDTAHLRLQELRARSGNLDHADADELRALQQWERESARVRSLAANPYARMGGTDPRSGYDAAQQRERDRAAGIEPRSPWAGDPRLPQIMDRHPDVVVRRARDSVERSHSRMGLPDRAAAVLDQALRSGPLETRWGLGQYLDVTGSLQYHEAFARSLLDPQRASLELTPQQRDLLVAAREARRSLQLGTPAAWSPGSYPVPYQLDPTVTLTSNGAINPLRQLARTEQIVGKEWLGVTSTGVSVTRADESSEVGDGTPTLTQPGVAPTRVQAFVPFSMEVEQDWNALLAELAMMLADAKDIEESSSFVNGAGTGNAPQGVVTALAGGAQEVTTAAAGTLALDDVTKAQRTVVPRFRPIAQWAGSLDYLTFCRTTERGITTMPILGSDGLLGQPAHELSSLDGIATGGHVAIVGDWKQFLIVDRIGMSIELVPHLFGTNQRPTGERGIYAMWRNSSQVLAPPAFALLTIQ